jgi:hypothetical protein
MGLAFMFKTHTDPALWENMGNPKMEDSGSLILRFKIE